MPRNFEEWCRDKVCRECKYDHLGSMSACRVAYEKDTKDLGFEKLLEIESKLDAIIKHFNVPMD